MEEQDKGCLSLPFSTAILRRASVLRQLARAANQSTQDGERWARNADFDVHNCSSAISSARSKPRALFSVSCRSLAGSLSATMPAPA